MIIPQVVRINVYPSYNSSNYLGDIAVLTLSSDAEFTNYVMPLCLWEESSDDLNDIVGKEGTVSEYLNFQRNNWIILETIKKNYKIGANFYYCVICQKINILEDLDVFTEFWRIGMYFIDVNKFFFFFFDLSLGSWLGFWRKRYADGRAENGKDAGRIAPNVPVELSTVLFRIHVR